VERERKLRCRGRLFSTTISNKTMKLRTVSIVSAAAASAALIVIPAIVGNGPLGGQPSPEPGPEPGPGRPLSALPATIPFHSDGGDFALVVLGANDEWRGRAYIGSANSVVVEWLLEDSTIAGNFTKVAQQHVSLSYRPSASSLFGEGEIALAGIDSSGAALIESIELVVPSFNSASGRWDVQPPSARNVDYYGYLPGYISAFRRVVGQSDRALAVIGGEGMVVELDFGAGSYAIVGAESPASGILDYPDGAARWTVSIDAYDLGPGVGHLYVLWDDMERSTFASPQPHPNAGAVDESVALDFYLDQLDARAPVVYSDTNVDGIIDASNLLDVDVHPAGSFQLGSSAWVEPWN